jgi:putative flavoprotein involved in K+ transport
MKPAVERFEGPRVIFADNTACAPDVVICATGYRPGLEALAGHLVRLDQFGLPPGTGGKPRPARPGLWFFGLDSSIYGNMHVRRRQARQLARAMTGALVSRPS